MYIWYYLIITYKGHAIKNVSEELSQVTIYKGEEIIMRLQPGDKIGITVCSNGLSMKSADRNEELFQVLEEHGLIPVCSDFIYADYSVYSGTGKERASALMKFYENDEIIAIFDISGGNIANEVLDYLDFNQIKEHPKPLFGYSDLTTVLNAIYTKTNQVSYLYQIKNIIYDKSGFQKKYFFNSLLRGEKDLFDIKYDFLQGNRMEGVLIGGNIRCLLKLAGTPYMPDFKGKILLLESQSGEVGLMTAFITQLKQMGVFEKITGVILGTFIYMKENNLIPNIEDIVIKIIANSELPIAKTSHIGHKVNSKAIGIGKSMILKREK